MEKWLCKYCGGDFSALSRFQKGAHVSNCLASPKRESTKEKLLARSNWQEAVKASSNKQEKKLLRWQSEAEVLYETERLDPLFNLGIGLYWGEGSKVKNNFTLTNSDPKLLFNWRLWLKRFANNIENFRYDIYGHSDVSESESTLFWKTELRLDDQDMVNFYNCNPVSSKNLKPGKCKYGTLRIIAGRGASEWNVKILHIFSLITNAGVAQW